VVARPAEDGYEILLLERPLASRFAAGAFVFPGGVVDADDEHPEWSARLPEVAGAEAATWVAAIRELFEETGILPAPVQDGVIARLDAARRELLADRRSFSDIARELDLSFRDARLAYFARWITPEELERRYDARFFFAALPDASARVALTPEHVSGVWASPVRALRLFRSGELPMLFPTWKTLEALAGHASLEQALAAMRGATVRTVMPRLRVSGKSVHPVLPGEPGYDEAR